MQQSNTYIIIFSLITTIVIGGLLSMTSVFLGPAQSKAIELDNKSQILGAVVELSPTDDVLQMYEDRITSVVVNINGEEVEDVVAENVNIGKQYGVDPQERLYPVFKYHQPGSDKVEAYIFPVYGNGLWDKIWGYVALETDLETIKGVRFDHASETPGLGARITEPAVQDRFKGKKLYSDGGELISVTMLKSERNPPERIDEHHVDGISGSTMTAKGVNSMLLNYFGYYGAYMQKVKSGRQSS